MTLDEAIAHSLEVAERYERMEDSHDDRLREECAECAEEHRQLAEWLRELKELRSKIDACNILAVDAFAVEKLCKELKEAKELLKAAVEGFEFLGAWMDEQGDCTLDCSDCPLHRPGYYCRGWNKQNEALALIGGAKNGNTED